MKAHNNSDRSFFTAGPLRSGLVFILLSGLLLLLTILAGCRQEEVEEPFEPTASHAAYREGLEKMELADTELGRRWISASEQAFTEAIDRNLPFEEHIFFHPADSYELLGTNGSFLYVETLNGTRGWLRRIQG